MTAEAIETLNDILDSRVNNNGQYNPIADRQLMYLFAKEIDKLPEFEIFSQKTQRLGNTSCAVSKNELLSWLIERSQTVGAEQALQDALCYSKATEIEVYDLMLLDSTYIDNREFSFCNGVTIAMLEKIPNQRFAAELGRTAFSGVAPETSVVSILYVSNSQPVSHPSDIIVEGETRASNPYNLKIDDLADVLLCLTLARRQSSVQGIAYGTLCNDDQPFIHPWSGWNLLQSRPRKLSPSVLETELRWANDILEKWSKLESDLRTKLKISLSRYSNFGSGISNVDKSIELRICIDALFGSDGERNDLAYRVGIRAAHFLGGIDKKATFETIKAAYSIGSNAAHTGKLKRDSDIKTLEKAAIVVHRALLKIIDDGSIDWKSVELGLHD